MLEVQDSIGFIAAYTYDSLGRQVTSTDGNGNTTNIEFNAFGLVGSTKVPGDESIGELTSETKYDLLGRKVRENDTAGNRTEYQYDTRGNLLQETGLMIVQERSLSVPINMICAATV